MRLNPFLALNIDCRYPDWFVENACELEPLFQRKISFTPNGLALAGNLIGNVLPRHAVRHVEQSDRQRISGSRTRQRRQIRADSEVRKYGSASGTSTTDEGALSQQDMPPSRTRKAIHVLRLLHSRRDGEDTLLKY